MSEQTAAPEGEEKDQQAKEHEETVPFERFSKVNSDAKEAKKRAADLEKRVAEMQAQMEEREQAGLPELERERKRVEQLEKRAADAEKRAEEQERAAARSARERLVLAAAASAGFDEADDALRYPEHVNLEDIESSQDAERAVKRLAKARPKLLKADESPLPGRVMKDGRVTQPDPAADQAQVEGSIILEGIRNLQRQGWKDGGAL